MTMRDLTYRPEEFSSFVGRSSEISELRELMRAMRAVTLCGAGGIGKTRLALRLLAAIGAEFPDGASFVELGEVRQPEHVVARVAAAVGVHEERGRPLLDTLADSLRHRRTILVLDNCEHLVNACAALCKRLLASSPGLQIVCTSREPLRVAAEAVWQVPPLALPTVVPPPGDSGGLAELRDFDAIRLFATRAAAATPAFTLGPTNAAAVATICRALDGLPLAIELAAAWVRVLSVDQIAARLDRRLALLTSADRSVPARQQTLRATFDWSYDLLSGPEQIMLRRLSVFPGWSLDMAEQVCADDSLPAADIVDLLTALADKSLIELEPEVLGEARYRLLETVREYAAGWLALAGETAVMERRRREYTVRQTERAAAVGMALEPGPWSARVDAFRRFQVEKPNLYEVLGSCLSDGDAETGLRLCSGFRLVWIVNGTFAEGAAWFDNLLALPAAAVVPDSVRGRALISRAQLAMATGSPQADEQASAGLELCWAAGEQFWVAAGLNLLTEIALHAGHPDAAAERADEALQVARSAGDRWNEGYALGTMAAIAGHRGNFRAAQRLGEEALLVMREIQQLWGSARALLGLGDLAQQRGEHGFAREYYLEALAVLREVDARPEIARCLAGLGRIALDQWDLVSARQHLTESLRLSYASGSRTGMARGLEALARLSVMEGNPALSVQLAGAMTALRAQAALPPVRGARTQRFLDAAAGLGEHTVRRLWAEGEAMTPTDAVRLALGAHADVFVPSATGIAAATAATGSTTAETSLVANGTAVNSAIANSPAVNSPAVNSAAASSTAAAGPATALTQREHEVVTLLAAGLSNRDIAAKLFISPATAARHVANILAKLGFSSRSQVAAWAAAQPASQPGPSSALDSPS